MKNQDKNCIRPDCLCDNRHDVHPYKHDEIPECKCGGVNCRPLSSLDKEFDKKFPHKNYLYIPDIKSFIRKREKELQDSLEDMVRQFAYDGAYRNKPAYTTGGLSALESAFHVLGWKEPHPCPENACEWKGCNKWSHCGTPYKKGYLRCCGEHYKKLKELSK